MKILSAVLLTVISATCFAQSPVSARLDAGVDIGAGFKSHQLAPSIAYYQLLNVGEKKLFSFGYSVKLGTFYGQDVSYTTAPARLTRGKSGLSSLGSDLVVANIDTVAFANVSMTNLNLGLQAQVNLGPVSLGVTADILGVGFGRSRIGQYKSSTGKYIVPSPANKDSVLTFQGTNISQAASPGNLNLRLLGDNNIGTLSSEVYARIKVDQRIGVKVGYQWLTTEMTVRNRDVVADNNRFRNRTNYPYLALTFFLF